MSNVYRITPLTKKSIIYHVEMYRENADGSISWFNLDETYRWGQGFIEEDLDCNLPWDNDKVAYAKADCGWGCEFDDSISCWFEFSDDLSEQEKEEIEQAYYDGGASWLFDGEHDWCEEDSAVHIIAPFQVSLCSSDGTVIVPEVKLRNRKEVSEKMQAEGKWPSFPKDSIQGG